MKTKEDIVKNWLPRYTGMKIEEFGKYILLTNFGDYLEKFASWHKVEIKGEKRSMPSVTAENITMIKFGMGSANAATIFMVGFANKIPTGALLLVADQPMISAGVKTEESDKDVTARFVDDHLKIGIGSLKQIINKGETVKHLYFDYIK